MHWQKTAAGVLLLIAAFSFQARSFENENSSNTYAVKAGWIYTMSNRDNIPSIIENGVLIVRDGVIEAVGKKLKIPKGMKVYDFKDQVIMPGLVASDTRIVFARGGLETISSKYRAIDGFDPYADYSELLSGGVTTIHLTPGDSRLISGVGAVVKLGICNPKTYILKEASDLCVNLGARNPPNIQETPLPASDVNEIKPAVTQRPTSALGVFLELRETFKEELSFQGALESGAEYNYNLDKLGAFLKDSPVLRIQARRASEIDGALRWAKTTGAKFYLTGAIEAHHALRALKVSNTSVVLEVPLNMGRVVQDKSIYATDLPSASFMTAAALEGMGISYALSLPYTENAADLLLAAAAAVRGGVDPIKALEAVTRTPAEILGVSDRIGSLTPKMDADFLVLSGKPLKVRTHVLKAFSSGVEVFSHPDMDQSVVIRAGLIMTGSGPCISDGEILIENGKIADIGQRTSHPAGAVVIDAGPDAVVTPGFIDGHGHIGLEGDRTTPSSDLKIADVIKAPGRYFKQAALSGVTTVILAPYSQSSKGSQVAAIKTSGKDASELVVDDLAALKFTFKNMDPVLGVRSLSSTLKSGKSYADKWNKYHEDLKKWEEDQAKKAKAADSAPKAEPPKKEAKTEVVEEKKEEDADPITGTWSYIASGGPAPEPQKGEAKLKLNGNEITGTVTIFFSRGEEVQVAGTLNGTSVHFDIDVETPVGKPAIDADITKPDSMKGKLTLGNMFTMDFSAERIEKGAPKITVSLRKKKTKDASGKPTPPKLDPKLEPFRRLMAGEIAALVDVNSVKEIKTVIKLFVDQYKVPLGLLGAKEAGDVCGHIQKSKASVVLPQTPFFRKKGKPYILADDLARNDIPVVLQSDAGEGAYRLPLRAAYYVHKGMSSMDALKALTINPARLYRIDDKVGSLEKGKDADIIIFSGDPFEIQSRITRVFISGKEVK